MPVLDQLQSPARTKKRVAFKDDDRLPRVAPGSMNQTGASRSRIPYGGMMSSQNVNAGGGGGGSPSNSPTRYGGRIGGVRGRQTASVGRVHTSL